MKHIYLAALMLFSVLSSAQLNYSFTGVNGSYTANSSPTTIHAANVDDALSAAINIGFTFQYQCTNYTQIKVSSNGWLTFNTGATGALNGNNLSGAAVGNRPIVAPLWDDLEVSSTGTVNYKLTGAAPNRVLTVEWNNMLWTYSATNPALSFQCKLYETSNRIEFVYVRNGNATANISAAASASIGLAGINAGEFLSLDGVGTAPNASSVTETTNLSSKPATGQIYRWDPVQCSGTPTAGTANASITSTCAASTNSILSLTGSSTGCGISYQWQSATSAGGPWSNIAGATTATYTANVTADRYYRCVLTCSNGGASGTSTSVFVDVNGSGAGTNSYSIASLPYSHIGQSTCGGVNDVTSAGVANICGSSNYYGGEDNVYTFTPTATGVVTITLSTGGSYAGMMLYQGCPFTGTCVANIQNSNAAKSLCTNVTAGVTYFLVIDSWPSPTCNSYDLTISSVTVGATGNTCATATPISSLPYSQTGLSTCCKGNDYTSANACASSYMNGEDYVFSYTPSANVSIDISLSNTLNYTGVFVVQGCPNTGSCVASNTSSSGNPSLCGVNLTAGVTYYIIVDTYPSPDCTPFDISIQQTSSSVACGLAYSVATTTYNSPADGTGGTLISFSDDHFSDSYINIPFTFCFDGIEYNRLLVSSNGYLIFDPVGCTNNLSSGNATPAGYSGYSISTAIPNTTQAPRNAILGPWHDIDPGVSGNVRYNTFGTAPNRRFVFSFNNIAMFSSSCNAQKFDGQIKLFETSYNIEVHLTNKPLCSTWNSGYAIMGLHNYNGTLAVVPAGYNVPTQWTATNQAWRFTNNCASCLIILPLHLLKFNAEAKLTSNHLTWSVATGGNHNFFVERSADGELFETLDEVISSGNETDFEYFDTNPFGTYNYYRISEFDKDGKLQSSSIELVKRNDKPFGDILIYPNPSDGNNSVVTFNADVKGKYELRLFDYSGRLLLSKETTLQASENFNLDLASEIKLTKGVYFLEISGHGVRESKRMVIN